MGMIAPGTQRRGPPPLPRASTATSTRRSISSVKRASVRPAPGPHTRPSPATDATWTGKEEAQGSGPSHASPVSEKTNKPANTPARTSPVSVVAQRNEAARTLTDEMQKEVRDIVRSAIERTPGSKPVCALTVEMQKEVRDIVEAAIEPILKRLRELEQSRAELPLPRAAANEHPLTSGLTTSAGTLPAASYPTPSPHTTVVAERLEQPRVAQATAAATTGLAATMAYTAPARGVAYVQNVTVDAGDVPWALNGSRRRKMVVWTLAILVTLALLIAYGATVLSHLTEGA